MSESEDCKRLVGSGITSGAKDFKLSKLMAASNCSEVAKSFQESVRIEMGTIHGKGRGDTENCVIEHRSVLPFCEQALPVERSELGVAQPDSRQVRRWAAGAGGHLDADHSIFAAIALGSFNAQFVKSLQIVLIDRRDRCAFLGCLDECSERLK